MYYVTLMFEFALLCLFLSYVILLSAELFFISILYFNSIYLAIFWSVDCDEDSPTLPSSSLRVENHFVFPSTDQRSRTRRISSASILHGSSLNLTAPNPYVTPSRSVSPAVTNVSSDSDTQTPAVSTTFPIISDIHRTLNKRCFTIVVVFIYGCVFDLFVV